VWKVYGCVKQKKEEKERQQLERKKQRELKKEMKEAARQEKCKLSLQGQHDLLISFTFCVALKMSLPQKSRAELGTIL
jgi:hypothetical protein